MVNTIGGFSFNIPYLAKEIETNIKHKYDYYINLTTYDKLLKAIPGLPSNICAIRFYLKFEDQDYIFREPKVHYDICVKWKQIKEINKWNGL